DTTSLQATVAAAFDLTLMYIQVEIGRRTASVSLRFMAIAHAGTIPINTREGTKTTAFSLYLSNN
ncbi:hypothetical protein SK128_010721, partial [Halocaridina rubra]